MTDPIFDTVAIVGLGLIGSSVARGLKARGLARRVIGYDSSTQVHARAKELGFCDHVANTPAEAVKDAELVLIAVPVGATADAVKSVAPHLREGAILTEVGSVKAAVIRQVLAVLPRGAAFVPGHPIAVPSIPAPTQALPNCSTAAGPSSPRACGAARRRWRKSPRCGAGSALLSRP
jgi:cyclohexadieny/prephenate dehydrogenase